MNEGFYIDIDKLWGAAQEKGFFTAKSIEIAAGLSNGALKRMQFGNFEIYTLIKLADALDVEPRDLLLKPIKEAANDSHI